MLDADTSVHAFFAALEAALGGPHEQSDLVLAEVRADLEAQVRGAVARGTDREVAWAEALESMGEPVALARSMRGALPPAPPSPRVRHVLAVLSGVVASWGVLMIFVWRSTNYGFDPVMFSVILGLHLPLALLLWPGLVWRWNPLFSTGAAAIAILLALGLHFGARMSTITYQLDSELVVADVGPSETAALLLPVAFAGLAVLTVTLLQRRRQRRVVLAWTFGLVATIEAIHQVEEALFRGEARHAEEWIDNHTAERGSKPTSEEFAAQYETRWLSRVYYYPADGQDPDGTPSFTLYWGRATQSHHELYYHSDGTIIGND
ncbi:MAG: hypothetical protein ACI835_005924 [Planctomycetota bacterium]|jgi:hypothetical protein